VEARRILREIRGSDPEQRPAAEEHLAHRGRKRKSGFSANAHFPGRKSESSAGVRHVSGCSRREPHSEKRFLSGAQGMQTMTGELDQLKIAAALPPGSKARLIRQGFLNCSSGASACQFWAHVAYRPGCAGWPLEHFCFKCRPGNRSQRGHSIEEWPLLAELVSSQQKQKCSRSLRPQALVVSTIL
jgi:hypothetical protein